MQESPRFLQISQPKFSGATLTERPGFPTTRLADVTTKQFIRSDNGDETTIRISGKLDVLTAPEMAPIIEALVAQQRRLVTVDLAGLDLIDSSGVAGIVGLYKRVRAAGGEVKVVGARDQPLAIFKLLRMDKVFNL
jgi:anti-sigma B factor antagonist